MSRTLDPIVVTPKKELTVDPATIRDIKTLVKKALEEYEREEGDVSVYKVNGNIENISAELILKLKIGDVVIAINEQSDIERYEQKYVVGLKGRNDEQEYLYLFSEIADDYIQTYLYVEIENESISNIELIERGFADQAGTKLYKHYFPWSQQGDYITVISTKSEPFGDTDSFRGSFTGGGVLHAICGDRITITGFGNYDSLNKQMTVFYADGSSTAYEVLADSDVALDTVTEL